MFFYPQVEGTACKYGMEKLFVKLMSKNSISGFISFPASLFFPKTRSPLSPGLPYVSPSSGELSESPCD